MLALFRLQNADTVQTSESWYSSDFRMPILFRLQKTDTVYTYECWYCSDFSMLILFRILILFRPMHADTVQTSEFWYCFRPINADTVQSSSTTKPIRKNVTWSAADSMYPAMILTAVPLRAQHFTVMPWELIQSSGVLACQFIVEGGWLITCSTFRSDKWANVIGTCECIVKVCIFVSYCSWRIFCKKDLSLLLDAFAKLRKSTVNFIMSVCLSDCMSVSMEHVSSHWTDFHEIWYLGVFRKPVRKFKFY